MRGERLSQKIHGTLPSAEFLPGILSGEIQVNPAALDAARPGLGHAIAETILGDVKPKSIAPLTVNPNEPALGSRHITNTATVAPINK